VWSVTGVPGRSSDLPCYLNPRTPGDRPKLILWYKRGIRTPVFTYDGREPQLQSGTHEAVGALTLSGGAATLTLTSVGEDSGGLYECRVDFFKSPTHTSLVNLTIIDPLQLFMRTRQHCMDVMMKLKLLSHNTNEIPAKFSLPPAPHFNFSHYLQLNEATGKATGEALLLHSSSSSSFFSPSHQAFSPPSILYVSTASLNAPRCVSHAKTKPCVDLA
ncbi:hypothetical protein O3P69_012026, partial [Scylla paramamosain]